MESGRVGSAMRRKRLAGSSPASSARPRGSRRRSAWFLVEGVDLGDGERVRCMVRVEPSFVVVRRHKSRCVFVLGLADAVGLVARRAQVVEAQGRLG